MIFDLHNDFPTALSVDDGIEYVRSCGGTAVVTAAVFTTEMKGDVSGGVARLTQIYADDCPIAIEDLGFLSETAVEFDFSPYLYCSLTWNHDNALAGGAAENGRLSAYGKRVIERMNAQHCFVDTAHLNRRSFYDVIDCAERIICSHTGFVKHFRTLEQEQISALVSRNALIGLSAVSSFSGANNASELAHVIDKFVQKYGCSNLALGTDFHGSSDIPQDISDYYKLETVKNELFKLGYNSEAVGRIFYDNAAEVLKRRVNHEKHL